MCNTSILIFYSINKVHIKILNRFYMGVFVKFIVTYLELQNMTITSKFLNTLIIAYDITRN